MSPAEMYMNIMLCVLMADGVVDEQERELFFQMVETVGLDPKLVKRFRSYFEDGGTLDLDTMINDTVAAIDPPTLAWIIQDAYLMADADDAIGEDEVSVINTIMRRAGVPESRFPAIREWAEASMEVARRGVSLFQY